MQGNSLSGLCWNVKVNCGYHKYLCAFAVTVAVGHAPYP
jgi:hypothetical protein